MADYLSAEFIEWWEQVRIETEKRIPPSLDAKIWEEAQSLRLSNGHKARERMSDSTNTVQSSSRPSQAAK